MNKYYISAEIENDKFVGKVFTVSTNQLVYTSKPYNTREQAISDVRTYIITSAPPLTDPNPPKIITTTASYTGARPIHTGRCCGR